MGIKAIVLDLDDTLYLERDFVVSGLKAVGEVVEAYWGDKNFYKTASRLFQDGERKQVINRTMDNLGFELESKSIQNLIDTYRDHIPNISLPQDSKVLLEKISGTAALGMITDGLNTTQWNKIHALNIANYFDEIVVTGDYGATWTKPSPLAFLHIQQVLCAEAGECIYIADNIAKDFVAPKSLGWQTMRICRPGGIYGDLVNGVTADIDVPSLSLSEVSKNLDLASLLS